MSHRVPRRLLGALLAGLLVGAVKAQSTTDIELPAVASTVLLEGGQQTTEQPSAPAPAAPPAVPVPPAIRQVIGQGAAPPAASPAASPPTAARLQRVALGPRPPAGGLELGPRTVAVESGTTALIEVAIDHLNRIVTPFATPVVHTVSNASTTVDGRVVSVGVRNIGSRTIPANASACEVGQAVAAVGAWPLKTLAPGQETEVLLVLQQGAAR